MSSDSSEKLMTLNRRAFMGVAVAIPFATTLPQHAMGQAQWPLRNITMVVPFPPGGQADLAARPVAVALQNILGRPVVVENRAGAGGAIGAAAVAKAEPDGHTMLMALNSIVISPEAERLFDRAPLYEMNQFMPIARVLADPNIVAVLSSSPWKSLQDLVDDARKRPGEITFSSSGNYGAAHVAVEMLAKATDTKFLHVPYRGSGPAIAGLIGNQVGLTASTVGPFAAHIEAGTVRALASMSAERTKSLPNVPTMRELGYPLEFYVWAGLFIPKGVPEPIVLRIRAVMNEALADSSVKSIFEKAGTGAAYMDAPEFAKLVQSDTALLTPVIKQIGRVQ